MQVPGHRTASRLCWPGWPSGASAALRSHPACPALAHEIG